MIQDIQHQSYIDNSHISRRRTRSKFLQQQLSYKSSLDISTVLQLQDSPYRQCRICLQAEQENHNNPLITPCKCIGSVKYVHQNCYRKWIQRQYGNKQQKQQKQILQQGIECQICKQKIQILFKDKLTCASCDKIKERFLKSRGLFLLFTCFIIANLSCLSYLSFYTAQNANTNKNSLVTLVMIVACFVFLGITGIVTIYYYINDFFLDKNWCLLSFGLKLKSKNRYEKNNNIKIHPISVQQIIQ